MAIPRRNPAERTVLGLGAHPIVRPAGHLLQLGHVQRLHRARHAPRVDVHRPRLRHTHKPRPGGRPASALRRSDRKSGWDWAGRRGGTSALDRGVRWRAEGGQEAHQWSQRAHPHHLGRQERCPGQTAQPRRARPSVFSSMPCAQPVHGSDLAFWECLGGMPPPQPANPPMARHAHQTFARRGKGAYADGYPPWITSRIRAVIRHQQKTPQSPTLILTKRTPYLPDKRGPARVVWSFHVC